MNDTPYTWDDVEMLREVADAVNLVTGRNIEDQKPVANGLYLEEKAVEKLRDLANRIAQELEREGGVRGLGLQ
jgi:hypothetical protein